MVSGWETVKIGDISQLITSGSRDWAKYYAETGSKFIRMTNLNRSGIHLLLDDLKFVNVTSNSADGQRTSLQTNDILLSITAELGKIGFIPENFGQAYINQHTALIRIDKNKAFPKFIAYQLSSDKLNKEINNLNDAGAKAGLNLSTVRSITVALPPLPEQTKIAEILSTLDHAIATTEQLLANSQLQKKVLMQQLLTRKKRVGGFSGEWKDVKIKEIGKVITGNTPPKNNKDNYGSDILWATAEDFKNKYIMDTKIKLSPQGAKLARLLPKGSLLITCIASIGKNAIADNAMATNQQINRPYPTFCVNTHFN